MKQPSKLFIEMPVEKKNPEPEVLPTHITPEFMSPTIGKVVSAILQVMADVKNVEKNTTIGKGQWSYKGVSDKDVKLALRDPFIAAGITILCIDSGTTTTVDKWAGQDGAMKMSVFVEAKPRYMIAHTSGEYIIVQGSGHGQDPMDKAAGKAGTYALKYALLHNFLIATVDVDDTDAHHSQEDRQLPPADARPPEPLPPPPAAVQETQMDPFKRKYTDKATILTLLDTATEVKQIGNLYYASVELVDSDEDIKKAFSEKKAKVLVGTTQVPT